MITKKKLEHIKNNIDKFSKEELYNIMLELVDSHYQKEYNEVEEEYVKRLKWDIVY